MAIDTFVGLGPPRGKHLEIMQHLLAPDPTPKPVDVCCGLGFGKTLIAIQVAAITLNSSPGHRGLFLEPDWDRVKEIFLPAWEAHVPAHLYRHDKGRNRIVWHNGSYLLYRPRVITGSRARAQSKQRGIPYTFVIDDEAAIGFDRDQYINTFARIRLPANIRYYLTISTPMVGPYGAHIQRGGNKLFRGRTRDNHYLLAIDPTYEERLRAEMDPEQARRELDGELIALEGRVWKNFSFDTWPAGNMHDAKWDPSKPWVLGWDVGASLGHWQIWQYHEVEDWERPVAVIVAEGMQQGQMQDVLAVLERDFVEPSNFHPWKIGIGRDVSTAQLVGDTAGLVLNQWGFKNWRYPTGIYYDKFVQQQVLTSLILDGMGRRHLALSRHVKRYGPTNQVWGLENMFQGDHYPDKGDGLIKDKDRHGVSNYEDPRDSSMYLAVTMYKPKWIKSKYRAA